MSYLRQLAIAVQAGALITAGICVLAMVGYALKWSFLTTWAGDTRMAIPTAISVFILSVCVWILGHILRYLED